MHALARRKSRLVLTVVLTLAAPAYAAEQTVTITVRDAGFDPAEVKAARDVRLRIEVVNETAQKIEFESVDLNCEHVVKPGGRKTFYVDGRSPGRYEFFDELKRGRTGVLLVE
jgi:hypothetical protein